MIMQWNRVKADELAVVIAMDGDALIEWMEQDRPAVDVDKAWHGIHAVLTRTAWPEGHELDGLVFGGTPFVEDFGYGPARYLRPDEVVAIASLVEAIAVADFEARTDLGVLAQLDVYPSIWDRQDEAETNIAYLRDGYAELRDTFQSARAANDAMIISLM